MSKNTKTCDECESNYIDGTSEMASMCPECSHWYFGYPNCEHKFESGECIRCGWDRSRSKNLSDLLIRHNMSDDELRIEIDELAIKVEELPRFQEVLGISSKLVLGTLETVTLHCEWRMEEYANTPDGIVDLKLLLNRRMVVKFVIPNVGCEKIEHTPAVALGDYLSRASSHEARQIEIILGIK